MCVRLTNTFYGDHKTSIFFVASHYYIILNKVSSLYYEKNTRS